MFWGFFLVLPFSWLSSLFALAQSRPLCFLDAKRAFDAAVSNIFGLSSSQISLLYFLHYCNSAGGIAKLIDSENGGAQSTKVKVHRLIKESKAYTLALISFAHFALAPEAF